MQKLEIGDGKGIDGWRYVKYVGKPILWPYCKRGDCGGIKKDCSWFGGRSKVEEEQFMDNFKYREFFFPYIQYLKCGRLANV